MPKIETSILFFIILSMSSPSLYSNDNPIQNRIETFQKDNYIHYAERIRPVQQIRPTSMKDIEEAEELNRKGLDLLHKSCGRENFRNLGDQFLQVIGFIELERLNELCIQSKSIPIPQEFHDRNDQTRFNALIQKTIQRFSIPQPIFLEKELKKEGILDLAKDMEKNFRDFSMHYMNYTITPLMRRNYGILPMGSSGGYLLSDFRKLLQEIHDPVKDTVTKKQSLQDFILKLDTYKFIALENQYISFQMNPQDRVALNQSIVAWLKKRNNNIQNHPLIPFTYKKRINNSVSCIENLPKKIYKEVNFHMWVGFFQDYGGAYTSLPTTRSGLKDFEKKVFEKIYDDYFFLLRLEGLEHGCRVLM
jgi:hypothetical protein